MSDYSTTRLQDHRTEDDAIRRRSQWSVVSSQLSSGESGFTLAELLVSMAVLVLLVLLFTQLLNSAATITILGHKRMDANSEARQVLDRMAFDFAQMVKRPDVDYYLKSSAVLPYRRVLQPGNDQLAFYSSVPGYYPTPSRQSPISLVACRVNSNSASSSYNKLERMSKGLLWNGAATSPAPVLFMPVPLTSPIPTPELPPRPPNPLPTPAWPEMASNIADWSSSEVVGPQVFRFEYYYLLTNGDLSDIPFRNTFGRIAVNGMQDVAAIVVDIAVIDPRSKVLVSDCQLAQLNGAPLPTGCSTPAQYPVLIDWGNTTCTDCPTQTQWQTTPGLLMAQWRAAIDANSISLPTPAISGIRVYERYFFLTH